MKLNIFAKPKPKPEKKPWPGNDASLREKIEWRKELKLPQNVDG
jgi:hypothetical protein